MKNTNLITMSQHRDGIAVSACGHRAAPSWARVRLVKGTDVKGHVGMFATTGDVAYLPGTKVWSPPPC